MMLPRMIHRSNILFGGKPSAFVALAVFALLSAAAVSHAAIPWDGEGNDGLWFNPANWNRNMNDNITLPPGSATGGDTDTEISLGTATLNGGKGVIYNPTPGPGTFFPPAGSITFPDNFGPQKIRELYISRSANPPGPNPVPDNTLTIQGDLELTANMVVGRSSGIAGVATNARVNQEKGFVKIHNNVLDLGQLEGGTRAGFGNGTYNYVSGTLEVGLLASNLDSGIRLSAGGSAGTGGIGRFIVNNPGPDSPGRIRVLNFNVAAHAGNAGTPDTNPNGVSQGVGIVEFHASATGTRPVQVSRNLVINNGTVTNGARSALLDLGLTAHQCAGAGCVPQNLGLFDVDFDFDPDNSSLFTGAITGAGNLGLFFSNATDTALYTEGATVSAIFDNIQYNWAITYTGNITWADQAAADNGIVQSILGTGGVDVVLVGVSSMSVGPTGVAGDYNDNGVVDAADYVIWRENQGTTNALPHDPIGGTIGTAQFQQWSANFGKTAAGGSALVSNAAVPEPAAMLLALMAAIGVMNFRRRADESM